MESSPWAKHCKFEGCPLLSMRIDGHVGVLNILCRICHLTDRSDHLLDFVTACIAKASKHIHEMTWLVDPLLLPPGQPSWPDLHFALRAL